MKKSHKLGVFARIISYYVNSTWMKSHLFLENLEYSMSNPILKFWMRLSFLISKSLKGSVANQECPSLLVTSLEISVPLTLIIYNNMFRILVKSEEYSLQMNFFANLSRGGMYNKNRKKQYFECFLFRLFSVWFV